MNLAMKNALTKRKDRSIAILLGVKERELDKFLPEDVQRAYRKLVLDQVNDLYEFAIDLLNSEEDGIIINQLYLDKIDEIYERLNNAS